MSAHRQFTGASAHAETALAVSWYSVCNVPLAINPNPPNKAIPIKELDMSNVNYLPPKALRRLLSDQCQQSGIDGVDVLLYAVIGEWLCRRYGSTEDWSLPEEAVTWLAAESGFKEDQRVKATYIAQLICDYHAGRKSAHCPIFTITCDCGRQVSRKGQDAHRYPMYRCICGRSCGYHKGDGWPLGLMADREARRWRGILHQAYDQLCEQWRIDNKRGYVKLAALLGVPLHQCHFSLVVEVNRAKEIRNIMQEEIDRIQREGQGVGGVSQQLSLVP